MIYLHTASALGSNPSLTIEFYAEVGERTAEGVYITMRAIVYFAKASQSLSVSNTLTAAFKIDDTTWYHVPITWNQSSGTMTGGAWTNIGSGTLEFLVPVDKLATYVSLKLKTWSTTMTTSGILSTETIPSVCATLDLPLLPLEDTHIKIPYIYQNGQWIIGGSSNG